MLLNDFYKFENFYKSTGQKMLLNDFYKFENFRQTDNVLQGEIWFNPDHAIFKGHFPGTPVVPGVCMMQIIKEIIEKHTSAAKRISEVQVMKFLTLINPAITPSVQFNVSFSLNDKGEVAATAGLMNESVVYFKFKGSFVSDKAAETIA
jgi:3-hydroxyacyl-[acyl-carrier-protein] dehydratase